MRLNFVLFAVLIVCALGVVTAQHRLRKLYLDLGKQQAEAKRLDVEWGRLQIEQATWATPSRIEQIASGVLHMKVPDASRVIPVFPAGSGKK